MAGPGRRDYGEFRDFGDFKARLEKHLEHLPDYAQRAYRQVERYLPAEQRDGRSGHRGRRPSLPLPGSVEDVPVVAELKSKWERWNEPAAKLERRKRRTSRALTLWIVLTILSGLAVVAGVTGASTVSGLVLGGVAAAVVFGALGVRAGMRLRTLNRTELPASTAPPPLPPSTSVARGPMERLAESEASLTELLTQLAKPPAGVSVTVPEVSVEDARATADEAAAALRSLAARIQAIERATENTPATERGQLEAAVHGLVEQLEEGLEEYGSLVAAAGRAVAASSGGAQPAKESLTDATDRLAGLAMALRELS
ncbi:phage shock envelope stress response protein PspM [Amycolatopsis cihanbeyliensis]|uniref:Uncharacterized protein n=1 Tax=Amycolatopsis cihanbeyliensis TaxID=1128664 RepID=A0A542CT50_AMYCI|nr:hypothetical protein [Amycolatopsis cihanbeyliensis]TQI94007.1 hypothetical protein FB471_6153 [Amycolatopsis cihanbeyliensis]